MTTDTTAPAPPRYRVVCAAGGHTEQPMTETEADQLVADVERSGPGQCRELHTIEEQVGDEWLPRHIARARRILAAPVSPTPIDLPDGPLIKTQGGWSREASQRPEVRAAQASGDLDAYLAALGPMEWAILTADGRGAMPLTKDRTLAGWCTCSPEPAAETWVRYERYSQRGREAHGYLCPTCRALVQSG